MPEKEPLNVFVCGNYKAAASREETDILKLIENVIQYSEQVRRLKEKFGDAKKEPDGLILHERGTVAMVRKRNTP